MEEREFSITLNEMAYPLAGNLRVAYMLQGMFNNKPYTQVFQEMSSMKVEDQIKLLYASFRVANPQAVEEWTQVKFQGYILDHFDISDLTDYINMIVEHCMGEKLAKQARADSEKTESNDESGNLIP